MTGFENCTGSCYGVLWTNTCTCDQEHLGHKEPIVESKLCGICHIDPPMDGQPWCEYCCKRYDAQRIAGQIA